MKNSINTNDLIYHYTSFDKLQYILKNSTLRFNESTKSNDILDTKLLVNILNDAEFDNSEYTSDIISARDFTINYFRRSTYERKTLSLLYHVSQLFQILGCFGMHIQCIDQVILLAFMESQKNFAMSHYRNTMVSALHLRKKS